MKETLASTRLTYMKHQSRPELKNVMWRAVTFIVLFLGVFCSRSANAEQLAFPGAEGFGRHALGGRGGQVLDRHVPVL